MQSLLKSKRLAVILAIVLVLLVAYGFSRFRPHRLTLTGIVTTHDVVVAPQVGGAVSKLLVTEGDSVTRDQLLAVIEPAELAADRSYYEHSAEGYASQVKESEAALRWQQRDTENQIKQQEAMLASTEAQQSEAAASLEDARITYERLKPLAAQGAESPQELDHARTAFDAAKAKADALGRQVEAQ